VLNTDVTKEEIRGVFSQVAIVCGVDGFRIAEEF
jgi:hypothetical protein